ncbi:DUF389 domain-containing protein [Collinsella sp. AGMB00827]|uniref:DUF389 domain-containing protein n=1 Tax=Collinsella ureilytica TaxID=2869515 RepID=A0ABS7MLS6_9ACTN|nr:DUF389 domain-containing protein [Collinsella urealyticum]MBY4798314.1 DUF389 domain-containing protein [Collinsella urealyticum]
MKNPLLALARLLRGGDLDRAALTEACRSSFVKVADPIEQYSSFFLRLALSAVIATGGVAAGSPAVVIGAMLIAPLMSPMLGTALAIVTGRPRAAIRTLLVTATGVALAIGVAIVVSAVVPISVNTATNQEVLARTSPRLVDLVVAHASGLMAALALIRDDIPDAAPGIAISASIVPPLCVVGIALQSGDLASAAGAMLLFGANFFSIQVMCCIAFAAMGLGARAYSEGAERARKLWYTVVVIGALAVAVPLTLASKDVIEQAARQRAATGATLSWLDTSDYRLREIDLDEDVLSLEIAGSGRAPSKSQLADLLSQADVSVGEIRIATVVESRFSVRK